MKVEISVPISIECVSVLAASIDETTVLFPFIAVRRTARATSPQMIRSSAGDAIVIDGAPIPYRSLSSLLGPGGGRRDSAGSGLVIVVQSENHQVAVGVDRLEGIRDSVVRPLPELCGPVPLIAGASLDGRGNPELLLDPAHLVSSVLDGPSAEKVPQANPPSTVLVVDDSLTTRMLEQSILESAGYRVEVATSGEEALLRARQSAHALFLVDAEMPGMSGFELLRCFQTDSVLQKVPAIMVTSRASAEDRRCAADAGARDYIVKSEFDERRLLQSIRELIDEVRS
jgi:two-component system chemotaxis sensor kinase CheA